ncbi:Gfo/Idh/MocA family protein [Paenibacillus chibensis]|uniref:Gfo/Idh/MocA family protein n=1 Tax=Paenibacillus chibensis TaxID=59846 RepID=UPI000FD7BD4A|nr:Gfo/Idh/MocA family oxidoreductase [Paenibacillus chibensis]MEC0373183.1 Gfo/Idh/MocA family oxidoreductase [Paenibacillus chibensis]
MAVQHRIIVAGCGGMANTWIDYAMGREDAEIVGLVDLKEEFAAAMAERKGLSCPIFTDIQQAVTATQANLVFDVTIPSSHHKVSTTALELGCHVFSEKPLAESMLDCKDIVHQAEQNRKTHAVMQNRRYDPRIRAYRHLIAEGTIGRPGFISADFFIGAHLLRAPTRGMLRPGLPGSGSPTFPAYHFPMKYGRRPSQEANEKRVIIASGPKMWSVFCSSFRIGLLRMRSASLRLISACRYLLIRQLSP